MDDIENGSSGAVIEHLRPLGSELERSYEVYVHGRLKFRVKQIVYVAFSLDERVMGFAFPKEERAALVASDPRTFRMPSASDLRFNWVEAELAALDPVEARELVVDAWRMVVPAKRPGPTTSRTPTARARAPPTSSGGQAMGELHVNMNITLDGVIQANGGPSEQDAGFEYAGWERPYGDAESGARIIADVQASDALLLGRTTYAIFRGYWPGRTDEIGRAFDRVPKYVASRGTPELSWATSVQVTDVAAEVRDLRARHEQIHTWGSANLLQTLFREALVDQVNLWVCPVVIGRGKRLFPEGTTPMRFEQVEPPTSYPGGAMLLRYRRLEGPPETVSESGQDE